MRNNCFCNVKFNSGIKKVLSSLSFVTAHAEEKPVDDPNPAPTVNYEQLIAKARQEEKDKLYPRIQKLEGDLKDQVSINNDLLLKNAALSEELAKQKKKKEEPDPRIAELEAENKKLSDKVAELESNTPKEDELREKIKAEYEVKMYAQSKINELKSSGKVLTMLLDTITGTTNEEVDAAVSAAIEKTKSVKKDLGIEDEDDDGDDKGGKSGKKKTTTTKTQRPPVSNPSSDGDEEEFDAEYIRNLDPRSPEYKEFRNKIGLR